MRTPNALRRHAQRGQAMVLFALTLTLLTLMVTMTLSFGTKAKEKMELQQVADQAAFSNAVAVARTYNVLAVTNRAMVAHMVAMLGVQSAMSFASIWSAYVLQLTLYNAVEIAYQAKRCKPPLLLCGCIGVIAVPIKRIIPLALEWVRLMGILPGLDKLAAVQVRNTRAAAGALYLSQLDSYLLNLQAGGLKNQKLAGSVVDRASKDPEWRTPHGADSVAMRESGLIPMEGAINIVNVPVTNRQGAMAAMASRGHPFTANRSSMFPLNGVRTVLNRALRRVVGSDVNMNRLWHMGNAYYGRLTHSNVLLKANQTFAYADDHAIGVSRYSGPGCRGRPNPILVASMVKSANPGPGLHIAGIGTITLVPLIAVPSMLPDMNHNVGGVCVPNCPSVWSNYVDYNYAKVHDRGDLFAQPKLPTVIQRDMRSRPAAADPWNLAFRFRFSPSGQEYQQGRQVGSANQGIVLRDGTDISRQTALSTGIAYYHRKDHWREPPNLFNPFWRAGLTRADIDDSARGAGGDIPKVLNDAGAGWAAKAYSALYNAGYRGLQ